MAKPIITNPGLQTSVKGVAITSLTLTATNSPAFWLSKDLPTGLSLNPTSGVISGTPTKAGPFFVRVFTEAASGGDNRSKPIEFEWIIEPGATEKSEEATAKSNAEAKATITKTNEGKSAGWVAKGGWSAPPSR